MQAGYRYDRDLDKKFLKAKLKVRKLDKTSLGLYDSIEEDTISATVSKESKKPTNDTMSTQTDLNGNDTTTYPLQRNDNVIYASSSTQVPQSANMKKMLEATLLNKIAQQSNAAISQASIAGTFNNPNSVASDVSRSPSKVSTVDPVQAKQQSLGSQLGSELSARLSQLSTGKKLSDLTKKKATESKSVEGSVVNNVPTAQSVVIPSNVIVPVLKAPIDIEDKAQIPSGLAPLDTSAKSESSLILSPDNGYSSMSREWSSPSSTGSATRNLESLRDSLNELPNIEKEKAASVIAKGMYNWIKTKKAKEAMIRYNQKLAAYKKLEKEQTKSHGRMAKQGITKIKNELDTMFNNQSIIKDVMNDVLTNVELKSSVDNVMGRAIENALSKTALIPVVLDKVALQKNKQVSEKLLNDIIKNALNNAPSINTDVSPVQSTVVSPTSTMVTDAATSMKGNPTATTVADSDVANISDLPKRSRGKPKKDTKNQDYYDDLREFKNDVLKGEQLQNLLQRLLVVEFNSKRQMPSRQNAPSKVIVRKQPPRVKQGSRVVIDNIDGKDGSVPRQIIQSFKNNKRDHQEVYVNLDDAIKWAKQEVANLGIGGTGMKRIGITAKRPRKGESLPMNSILLNQFDKGHLSVVTKKGNHVMTHKNMSPAFKRIVESIMKTGTFEASDYTQVTDKELPSVNQFIIQSDALIPSDTPYKSTNDHIKETKDRYNILVGELASGNTGRVVRDEMEKILREMWRLRQITHKAFKSRLLALKEYS